MDNTCDIGKMYVKKCTREYIGDNKESILKVLEKVHKKVDFEEICGEIRDGVCDRIADEFREWEYWDVYWGCWNEVLREVEGAVGEIMGSRGKYEVK